MATIRFQAGEVGLELAGSESFVERQLLLLAPFLGEVDSEALPAAEPSAVEESSPESTNGSDDRPAPAAATESPEEPREEDGLRSFYLAHEPRGRDSQTDAALLLAYYLNRMEGREAMRMRDLVQSCIRAGVDTRNLNRPLGLLTRRGLLEQADGNTYRISSQGLQAVESRL